MTEVENPPVRRRRVAPVTITKSVDYTDNQLAQRDPVPHSLEEAPDFSDTIQAVDPKHIEKEYLERLKMDNDPVTIVIAKGNEQKPALTVPVWVQGIGAEVLKDGKWVQLGWLPVDIAVTTKRKYVEALARAKPVNVDNEIIGGMNAFGPMPQNQITHTARALNQFSVLEDRNPKGGEWLRRLAAER